MSAHHPSGSTPRSLEISLAGETVYLHPQRALWWPREGTLFIADPHFGKAATFRHAGIPVPEAVHEGDLARLSALLTETHAKKLVILGDFIHARQGFTHSTIQALSHWRSQWAHIEVLLIKGNHDRHAGVVNPWLDMQVLDGPLVMGPFAACHEPQLVSGSFTLCGHLHPAYRIASATAPCFHQSGEQLIFPAFGEFTGKSLIKTIRGDRVFLVADHEVLMLPIDLSPHDYRLRRA